MGVSELRCTSCSAPIDPSHGQVSVCPYCGVTLVIGDAKVVTAAPTSGVVFLEDPGPHLIEVVKIVREHTFLGLKEAKNLTQSAPCKLSEWGDPERTAAFRAALIGAGAKLR
jgi:ribosomal protein L7/L12